MSFINAFNKQLLNLLSELSKLYPSNLNLKSLKNSLFLLIKTTPNKAINIYYESVYIYKDKIMNENEEFFLCFDLKGTLIEEFEYIKKVWETSSENNKKTIWTYFKVFNKLVEKHFKL